MVTYEHINNAGNLADIWKHNILLKIISQIKPKTYFETHSGFPYYNLGDIHLGSFMKVRLATPCSMTVCDTNQNIANFIPAGLDINFLNVDGWSQIHMMKDFDFYFIDPPYTETNDFYLVNSLMNDPSFTAPMIAWYPILKNQPFKISGVRTAQYYFKEGKLLGCGMLFKNIPDSCFL